MAFFDKVNLGILRGQGCFEAKMANFFIYGAILTYQNAQNEI